MTLWNEGKLPGFASTSHYPVGEWQNFVVDPGWDADVRTRTIFASRCAQFKGVIRESPAEEPPIRIGVLAPAFRPTGYVFITGGKVRGEANLSIATDGVVTLLEPIAPSSVLHVVYPIL